jgi:predicted dehydrogenase
MGRAHALAWRNAAALFGDIPAPSLLVVCDTDAAAADAAAEAFGFKRAATDWGAVLADPAIEAVSITTPNGLHRPMAVAALEAGKHVWCEKPMALTVADAEAMADAAARARGQTLLGYNYVRNPVIDHARRLIAAGTIGRVAHFRGCIDEDYSADAQLPWSWRCRAAEAGLGVLGDLMCHLLSMSQVLIGRIVRVAGDIDTVHAQRPMPGDGQTFGTVENEDVANALVRFEGGATGVLAASRVAWGRKNRLAWEIHGTAGTLAFDQERLNELQLFVNDGPAHARGFRRVLTGPLHPPYGAFCPAAGHGLGFGDLKTIEATQFLRAIAGGPPAQFSFAEGLHIERAIHGIAESAASGSWVNVG